MKTKFKKWQEWIDKLETEINHINLMVDVNNGLDKIINNNPRLNVRNKFFTFMINGYRSDILTHVRALAETGNEKFNYSIANLLKDISLFPEELSKVNFFLNFKNSTEYGNGIFKKVFGPGRDFIDPDIVKVDLRDLRKRYKKLQEYIDRRVAHLDRRELKCIPEYSDIEECVKFLTSLFNKYYLYLNGCESRVVKQSDDEGWKDIFEFAWIG